MSRLTLGMEFERRDDVEKKTELRNSGGILRDFAHSEGVLLGHGNLVGCFGFGMESGVDETLSMSHAHSRCGRKSERQATRTARVDVEMRACE